MTHMHSLLKRQLKRHLDDPDSIPPEWQNFIGAVNDAYWQSDADRNMLERSLDLSSQELLQANSELRAIFQAFPDLLYRLDNEGTILDCKAGSKDDLYIPLEKLIGKKIHEVPFDIVGDKLFEAIHQVRKRRSMASIEYPMQIKGQENYYEARLLPLLEDQIIVIVRNITEHKNAEMALLESESKLNQTVEELSAIINTLPGMISVTDLDYNILIANHDVIEKFGHSRPEEVIGKKCYEVRKGRDSICPECGVKRALETGETFVRLSTPQEEKMIGISTKAYSSPIRNDEGIVWGAVEVIMDVTDLRQAEEELILLATAIEQASESVIIADRDGMIRYANPAFEQLSGFTREEITGDNFHIFKSDKDDEELYKKMWNIISNGKVWAGRITNRMKDGTLCEFETRISPVRDSSGEIVNFVSVHRDITHEIELEAQLQQAHKMEAIGTLAGGIAHDFNNILGIILGNTELAMDDVPEWNPAKYNLEEIRTASLRAKDVARQLLSFARKTKLEKKPTNIIPIVKESLKLLRSSIPTSIEMRQNIPKDIDTILADPTQINQVLINLCTNADYATPDGGIIEVTLKNVELDEDTAAQHPELIPGRYVNLIVSDTGHGIAQEDIDRIFDPYFTTKEVGKGTGMGLSVVHGIVKSHGGTISVESELGKGATFSVLFPVIEKEAVVETETDEELPAGNERILFVDDEESMVYVGRYRLERLGYQVEAQTSPAQALKLFQANPDQFDLVITDMTMPQMTGDILVKKILKIRPDMPTILCTGFSEKIDEERSKELGISAYIEKPFDRRDFAKLVRKVLDEK